MSTRLSNIELVSAPDLQLKEDIRFLKKEVIFQRISWALMLLLICGGSVGVFGTGFFKPVSKTTGDVLVDYSRFLRFNNEENLLFQIKQASGKTIIKIPLRFSEDFEIQKIFPEPAQTEIRNGWMICRFSTTGKSEIRFTVAAQKAGKINSHFYINDQHFSFSQFIYP